MRTARSGGAPQDERDWTWPVVLATTPTDATAPLRDPAIEARS